MLQDAFEQRGAVVAEPRLSAPSVDDERAAISAHYNK